MKTISQIIKAGSVKGTFGVEIEVEANRGRLNDINYSDIGWVYTRDDSLRGEACELVFPRPKDLDKSKELIDTLMSNFDARRIEPGDNGRSGTHIHVNMRDLTVSQVLKFAFYWYMIEQLVITWNGESREANMFALPIISSPHLLDLLPQFASRKNVDSMYDLFHEDHVKYSALNFCRLRDLGTLETRCWSPVRMDVVKAGLDILHNIKEIVKEDDSLLTISEDYSMTGIEEFLSPIFKEHYEKMRKEVDMSDAELRDLLQLSFRSIQFSLRECHRELVKTPKKKTYGDESIPLGIDEVDVRVRGNPFPRVEQGHRQNRYFEVLDEETVVMEESGYIVPDAEV
jgi:hypothetical protein